MTRLPRLNTILNLAPAAAFSWLLMATPQGVSAKNDPTVFDSKPATFAPDIFGDKQKTDGQLRVLTLDERVGYERKNELVRVPVFFHAAEATDDPNGYVIEPLGGGAAIPYQADDIRRDASGKIARMHLYFYVDSLPAWGRKQFTLSAGKNPGADAKAMPAPEAGGNVTLSGDDIKVSFHTSGPLAGTIAGIDSSAGKVTLPDGGLAPSATLVRQDPAVPLPKGVKTFTVVRQNEINYAKPQDLVLKSLRWGAGPVISKLVVRIAPKAAPTDIAEYVYVIPKHGNEIIQTQIFYPEEDTTAFVGARGNVMLAGKIVLGDSPADQAIVKVPAGLRKELRTVFSYQHNALVNAKSGISILSLPYTESGGSISQDGSGRTVFTGAPGFGTSVDDNSGSLRAFWAQERYLFSKETDLEELWNESCKGFQPLTAVVDEPWAEPQDLFNIAKKVSEEYFRIQNWGRGDEANLVMNYLTDKPYNKFVEGEPIKPDFRSFVQTQESVDEFFKKKGGQAPAPLDPYTITYNTSVIVPFSAFIEPSAKLDMKAYALGKAVLFTNDHVTPHGWPNLQNFANTFNMKMGPYLCALWGGIKQDDHDLVQRARDAVLAQSYMAECGHGQRPYNSSPGEGGNTDVLYISVTDYWLRTMELVGNEDLSIHPSIYGRYFDMVDVNADIYQRNFPKDPVTKEPAKESVPTWWRAIFLRGQQYAHRWESYGCDPFLGVLGKASDHGKVGITESCYYMQKEVGKQQSWQTLMTNVAFPAFVTHKGISGYEPAPRPALPEHVQVSQSAGRNVVTWSAVPNAVGYRIYRAKQVGGPWTWVNSPYTKMTPYKLPTAAEKAKWQAAVDIENQAKLGAQPTPEVKPTPTSGKPGKPAKPTAPKKPAGIPAWTKMPEITFPSIPDTLVKGTSFTDPKGEPGAVYLVTAQDKDGRESRWFPNEPLPSPGK